MSSLVSPCRCPPGIAGDAGRPGPVAPGEKTSPFGAPAVGVAVPDPPDEPVGSEVVDWNKEEREALEER